MRFADEFVNVSHYYNFLSSNNKQKHHFEIANIRTVSDLKYSNLIPEVKLSVSKLGLFYNNNLTNS